jgi:nicotinamide-nucleotide amidase
MAAVSAEAQARALIDAARARGWKLATAESCTGGLLSAAITDIAGSSDVFDRGFVTYSYPSKVAMLGVAQALLTAHGAVSEPVARAMAEGAFAASDADLAAAVTGVAGPGASESKPEGLVWFAVATVGGTRAERRDFGALGRARVRARSVETALELMLQAVARAP